MLAQLYHNQFLHTHSTLNWGMACCLATRGTDMAVTTTPFTEPGSQQERKDSSCVCACVCVRVCMGQMSCCKWQCQQCVCMCLCVPWLGWAGAGPQWEHSVWEYQSLFIHWVNEFAAPKLIWYMVALFKNLTAVNKKCFFWDVAGGQGWGSSFFRPWFYLGPKAGSFPVGVAV